MDAVWAGLLAGYAIAIPVGAIAVLIIGLSARHGLRVGASAAMGTATADGIYAAIAVLGGAGLARLITPIAIPMRWLASGVLISIAVATTVSALRHHRDPAAAPARASGIATPGRAYATVLGLTLLNPATIVYFGALVLGRRAGDGGSAGASVAFVAAVFAASTSWQLLLAGGGSLIGRLLTGVRGRLITALLSSLVIATLAVLLVLP
jgi:arginine exporter protein ArgO